MCRARPSRWCQSYETRVPVQHFDLYRLVVAGEIDELGFDEALADGAVLVEWPERAARPAAGRDTVWIELVA